MRSNETITLQNQKVLLIQRPDGLPKPTDVRFQTTELKIPSRHFCPEEHRHNNNHNDDDDDWLQRPITATDLLLETLYISIDPAMRGWMSSAKSYLPPVKLGSVMRASAVCRIVASSGLVLWKDFPIGSIVQTEVVGVQSYCLLKNCTLLKANKLLTKLEDPSRMGRRPTSSPLLSNSGSLSYASYLGVLGTTGLTAYFGLLKVGKPEPNDIVLVSGAAGATGSIVCQIAKHVIGCARVIGTAGADEKCDWLVRNKIVDVAINYKTCKSLSKAISNASGKKGVGLVFDNVGSSFLEAALSNLSRGGRIVLCGAISQYNTSREQAATISGPRNYMNLLTKRGTMQGFVVFDYRNEYPKAVADLVRWIREGKIVCYKEDMRHRGIQNFYSALLSLFEGTNVGKVVLAIEGTTRPTNGRAKL